MQQIAEVLVGEKVFRESQPTELAAPKRRATFTPPTGPRVNVWRILSRDPDRDEDNEGVLVEETVDHYFVQVDGDAFVSRFHKKTRHGVTAYRIHKLREPSS
jgi:hypothetical protein